MVVVVMWLRSVTLMTARVPFRLQIVCRTHTIHWWWNQNPSRFYYSLQRWKGEENVCYPKRVVYSSRRRPQMAHWPRDAPQIQLSNIFFSGCCRWITSRRRLWVAHTQEILFAKHPFPCSPPSPKLPSSGLFIAPLPHLLVWFLYSSSPFYCISAW